MDLDAATLREVALRARALMQASYDINERRDAEVLAATADKLAAAAEKRRCSACGSVLV